MTFTRSHKGAYMDLLMCQFNQGHMEPQDIRIILGSDYDEMWESKLKCKFKIDASGRYYNEKLEAEVIKRKNFTLSRKKNLSHKKPHMVHHMKSHMENENENRNKDKNNINKAKRKTSKSKTSLPASLDLTEEMAAYAKTKGVNHPADEFEKFKNWALSTGAEYIDWVAAWRTRCMNYKKFNKENRISGGISSHSAWDYAEDFNKTYGTEEEK